MAMVRGATATICGLLNCGPATLGTVALGTLALGPVT
jgi:hypothetical protein